MAIKFKEAVKHGPQTFLPNVSLGFDDPRAEEYFTAAGWADKTTEAPVYTYPEGTVEIDPETVSAATGAKVLETKED